MIRPYIDNDRERLIELFRLNTPIYFHPAEQKDLESYLIKNANPHFVIEHDGVVVGCGGYYLTLDPAEGGLSWYFIHPAYHSKGLGRQLVNFCLDELRRQSYIKKIIVRTSDLAHGFYGKFGFVLKAVQKDYWAEGMDLYLMEKNA